MCIEDRFFSLQRGRILTANPLIINNKMFDSRSKGGCFLFIGEKQTFILDACAAGVVCGADLNVFTIVCMILWCQKERVIVRVFCCNN